MNVVKLIDFTNNDLAEGYEEEEIVLDPDYMAIDVNGHGTFVAGLIGSHN